MMCLLFVIRAPHTSCLSRTEPQSCGCVLTLAISHKNMFIQCFLYHCGSLCMYLVVRGLGVIPHENVTFFYDNIQFNII